jgi:hypothetical protein
MIAGVAFILVVGGGLAVLRAGAEIPQAVQWFIWFILALMLYGILVGVRQLITPPLMFIANNEGIVTFYVSDHNNFTGPGILIPWASIADLTLEKRSVQGSTQNLAYVWLIACRLKADANFDVKKHSVGYASSDGQRVVCLDAFTGTVMREELLERLRALWQDNL